MKPPADRVGANARGIFWSLAAVGLFALIYLSGRFTGDVAATVLLYVNLFGALILTVPATLAWRPIPVEPIVAFLCLGPLALLGRTCNLVALRHADVALLAPVRYSGILFGALFGYRSSASGRAHRRGSAAP